MRLLYDNGNPKNSVRVFEHNGYKFRMDYKHSASCNYDPTLSVMDKSGKWNQIETSSTVNANWNNLGCYVGKDALKKLNDQNNLTEKSFINYIESVYY